MTTLDKVNQMIEKIQEKEFIHNTGLGNEISFYVFDYPPQDELLVRDGVNRVVNKLIKSEINIIVVNLLDIFFEILEERNLYEKVIAKELQSKPDDIQKRLRSITKAENIVSKILEKAKDDYSILFITGCGSVYPFVRAHDILNHLHGKIENKPVVLFFPGQYNMQTFRLFEILEENNYYRAFRLID